jgi:hypothetical protein
MNSKKSNQKWREWLVSTNSNGSVPWRMPGSTRTKFDYTNHDPHLTVFSGENIIWIQNDPFKASLKFIKMYHGAKESTHAIFENTETNARYVMRNQDLEYCLQKGVLIHGLIIGEWRFKKDAGRLSITPTDLLSKNDFTNQ